jgi:hypothetical protein
MTDKSQQRERFQLEYASRNAISKSHADTLFPTDTRGFYFDDEIERCWRWYRLGTTDQPAVAGAVGEVEKCRQVFEKAHASSISAFKYEWNAPTRNYHRKGDASYAHDINRDWDQFLEGWIASTRAASPSQEVKK